LVADLRQMAPPGAHGVRARAALDRLLDMPDTQRLAGLAVSFEEFAQACAAAVPESDAVVEDLRAFVREHHAPLLIEPVFAQLIEGPRRRTSMMAWLLRENLGSLERTRSELHLRQAEIDRLRQVVERIDAERLTLESDLERSRTLADRGLAAAGLAHDFNNILQAVVGHASIALGGPQAGHAEREALEQVVAAAKRAAELSRGLSRWEHGEAPKAGSVDVNAVVVSVLDLLSAASPRHVDEQRVLPPDLPPALVDPTDLRRIVLNLVMNAWQALGARQGTVRVSTGASATRNEEMVYVEVEDDGPGIDDEVRARVFEPFYTTREGGGGVGLANVRLLVDRWGGRIEVWSTPGEGARFRASLPVAPEADEG
jgi:signal transduction histidine kinase